MKSELYSFQFQEGTPIFYQKLKETLQSSITTVTSDLSGYMISPGKDLTFTKISPDTLISFLISQGATSTKYECLDFFIFLLIYHPPRLYSSDGSNPSRKLFSTFSWNLSFSCLTTLAANGIVTLQLMDPAFLSTACPNMPIIYFSLLRGILATAGMEFISTPCMLFIPKLIRTQSYSSAMNAMYLQLCASSLIAAPLFLT